VFLQRGSTLAVSAQRRTLAATFGVVTLTLATALMLRIEPRIELSSVLLVYLTLTVVTAAIGGGFVAIPAGVAAVALANFFITEPVRTFHHRRLGDRRRDRRVRDRHGHRQLARRPRPRGGGRRLVPPRKLRLSPV
jgi:hypothetical protein